MHKFILLYFGFTVVIFASPKESISLEKIYVGDITEYTIEWKDDDITDISLPEGKFYEDHSLPTFEIQSVTKEKNKITASVIFFSAGDFFLPTTWKENGVDYNSKLKINVLSNLTGTETEIEDIEPPIIFSGPYFLRLIGLILFTCINLYLIYALYLYWKSKPKIVDAAWEKSPKLLESTKRLQYLEQYIQSEKITEKELTFRISEYLKEVFSEKFQENLLGNTDSEFLAILHDKTHIPDRAIRDLRLYFRNLKYNENSQIISKEDAEKIWDQIKKDFIT
ncbi:LB_053 family protein [Leptospira biflexa]|uniref:LB_053 family protein n=1 Tax=Leptospira biflexa TaxID=172 RepID=UPI001083ECDF|nr:hypothetical protein [Leptospira biflexa]TGM32055.1 hypothetical protein EHQ80_17305 [Leptospira biflexa]TGM42033.1 hypothetical protein EHQ89_00535 [Leptospira biflexa]